MRESLGRLDLEVDRRLVRAPIAGTIAEAAALRPGAFVSAGQTLGVVMPAGRLVLVTRLPPAALGRVAAGQPSSRLILQDRETKRSRSPRGPGG
ncbi:MAG TPA: HlyD family secretion protein [Thermoanaerobaculia bacterium]|nr:HlyD family secretion protein [Thermoanaerobaculia bacterium]